MILFSRFFLNSLWVRIIQIKRVGSFSFSSFSLFFVIFVSAVRIDRFFFFFFFFFVIKLPVQRCILSHEHPVELPIPKWERTSPPFLWSLGRGKGHFARVSLLFFYFYFSLHPTFPSHPAFIPAVYELFFKNVLPPSLRTNVDASFIFLKNGFS
jgi:hypothetical protein